MIKQFVIPALLITGSLYAQEDVLFTVEGYPTTVEEFRHVYNKNKDAGREIDPKTPREYLDLYVNFKLKVHEAVEQGMDTTQSFLREYNSYKEQLAAPYLSLKEVNEAIIQEAYSHMHWDIRARHIMRDLAVDALPEDTARLYADMMDLREKLLDGELEFDQAAQEWSTDTYSARMGGDLGWFTAFNMVYPFEKAAYSLDEGEISLPVRSRYGYHLIETTGRRSARGRIEVAHILAYIQENATEEVETSARRRINEIYEKAGSGSDFAQLARQFSDDKTSANDGGTLPVFGMKEMLPEFEEASFALEKDGDISEPFRTKLGWHIVKRIRRYEIETLEDLRSELTRKIQRDSRSNLARKHFISKLRDGYDFEQNSDALLELIHDVDERYTKGEWRADKWQSSTETVFQFADVRVPQSEVAEWLETQQERAKSADNPRTFAYGSVQRFIDEKLMVYEEAHLADKYPEYRWLVQEYREGILLFDLTKREIWDRSARDSAGLRTFYEENRDNYRHEPRYKVVKISSAKKGTAREVLRDLNGGRPGSEILLKHQENSELAVVADTMIIPISRGGQLHEEAKEKPGVYGPWEEDDRWVSYHVLEVLPEGPKPLREVRGLVMSDYQKELERVWIRELRGKYSVVVNEDTMYKLESEL